MLITKASGPGAPFSEWITARSAHAARIADWLMIKHALGAARPHSARRAVERGTGRGAKGLVLIGEFAFALSTQGTLYSGTQAKSGSSP